MEERKISGELRFGAVMDWYYRIVLEAETLPKQIDLLDDFFPGLLIEERASDGETKIPAEYDLQNRVIRAVRYHGHLYVSGSRQVTQILGRLFGTAQGSLEKERATTSELLRRAAGDLCGSPAYVASLARRSSARLSGLTDEQMERFLDTFADYYVAACERRSELSMDEKEQELFPVTDETFADIMENIAFQWEQGTGEGVANAFTWMLLFCLLRNDCERLVPVYLSSFRERRSYRHEERKVEIVPTSDPAMDGVEESYYEGDDLDRRFPGIEWFCDRCGEHLNEQEGFDDHLHVWKCTRCGYENRIEMDNIYDSGRAYEGDAAPTDPADFYRALRERTEEVEKGKKRKQEEDAPETGKRNRETSP